MLPNDKKSDSWRKTLKLISHCPICGHDYKSKSSKLFINESEARFVHFTCDHCQSNFMAMVMMLPKGMSTVGMVTDLSLKDVEKLYKLSPITVDEAIEGHKIFNNPDFISALKRNPESAGTNY
ncbi:MAG TPA: hypothetical protein VLK22_03520 [Candidatus Udaeobacter sp.]|nr:hypothetical protein [Candidatus Udaeobacter sp.]